MDVREKMENNVENCREVTYANSSKAQCQNCKGCQITVQKYEHYCSNCDRYEPIDSDSGWCGSTKVSPYNWCESWR